MPVVNKRIQMTSSDQYLLEIVYNLALEKLKEIFGKDAILDDSGIVRTAIGTTWVADIYMYTEKPTPHPSTLKQGVPTDDGISQR